MASKEQYWIDQTNCSDRENGYNLSGISRGNDSQKGKPGVRGRKHTEEWKRKNGDMARGRKHTPETLAKMRGRKLSEETKAKMRKPKSAEAVRNCIASRLANREKRSLGLAPTLAA